MFTPSRLTLARNRRGYTKKRLAELIAVDTRSIIGFESGGILPSTATVDRISRALAFPQSFFEADDLEEVSVEAVSFRSLSKLAAADRNAALASASLGFALHDWISERFKLPEPRVPRLNQGIDPETAAQVVRAEWDLGSKAAPNLIHLLELKGVRIFSLAQDCHELDAFSLWRSNQPFVFLNTQKSAEHSRFDVAHELAHLVLHWHHDPPQGRLAEKEAHRFAAAFLMPASNVLADAPRHPTIEQLIQIKKRWKVSVAALAHRLHELKALTDWHYRTINVEMGRRGYRTDEPDPIHRETSQVLNKVFAALRREGFGKADLAQELHLEVRDLDALVFGLAMLPVDPDTELSAPGTPRLRSYPRPTLVES